jgi:uncharacterized protein (DUF1778 family)
VTTTIRKRDQRIEVRATVEERALIDQAVASSGSDMTTFVLTNLLDASRRILADRVSFGLSFHAAAEWDRINSLPARELQGLAALFERPSPFTASE